MPRHKEDRLILMPGQDYSHFIPYYSNEKNLKLLKKFYYYINNDYFEFNPDTITLKYIINVDGLKFEGRVTFDRLYYHEQYSSIHDVHIRNNNGNKIHLTDDEKSNTNFTEIMSDFIDIDLENDS